MTFKEEIIPIPYNNIFQKIEAGRILLNSFYKASVIPTSRQMKIRKLHTTLSLMDIDTKILNELLAN